VSDIAQDIKRNHQSLAQYRANFERDWRSIEERLSILGSHFQTTAQEPGRRGTDRQFDITATLALQKFGAAMDSLISPSTQRYHGLAPIDPVLRKRARLKRWCEEATDVLFARRYRMRANFQAQM
jgi:hypothetical protein